MYEDIQDDYIYQIDLILICIFGVMKWRNEKH